MRAAKFFAILALAIAAVRPGWSQVTTQLLKDQSAKTPAPQPKPTTEPAASAEDEQTRMETILENVKNGVAITKADQKWALDTAARDLKTVESGEAEKKIMTAIEAKVDAAIAAGKVPADKKAEIMAKLRAEVQEALEQMKEQIKAAIEALKKAKTK
jgi:hypothetical protein